MENLTQRIQKRKQSLEEQILQLVRNGARFSLFNAAWTKWVNVWDKEEGTWENWRSWDKFDKDSWEKWDKWDKWDKS